MNAQWIDWLAVGFVVAGAAIWLAVYYRRKWRRKNARTAADGKCGTGCDGCPFGKDCTTKGH